MPKLHPIRAVPEMHPIFGTAPHAPPSPTGMDLWAIQALEATLLFHEKTNLAGDLHTSGLR